MADEAFDHCECIWNQKLIMERLLSFLRQSQNYCTDTECFDISQFPGPCDAPMSSNFFMICLIIAFVIVMYAFRPNSLRRLRSDNTKDRDNERDSNNDPPAPPSTTH